MTINEALEHVADAYTVHTLATACAVCDACGVPLPRALVLRWDSMADATSRHGFAAYNDAAGTGMAGIALSDYIATALGVPAGPLEHGRGSRARSNADAVARTLGVVWSTRTGGATDGPPATAQRGTSMTSVSNDEATLCVVVDMPDGTTWAVPVYDVAHDRASYMAENETDTARAHEILTEEMEHALADPDVLREWINDAECSDWLNIRHNARCVAWPREIAASNPHTHNRHYDDWWLNAVKRLALI